MAAPAPLRRTPPRIPAQSRPRSTTMPTTAPPPAPAPHAQIIRKPRRNAVRLFIGFASSREFSIFGLVSEFSGYQPLHAHPQQSRQYARIGGLCFPASQSSRVLRGIPTRRAQRGRFAARRMDLIRSPVVMSITVIIRYTRVLPPDMRRRQGEIVLRRSVQSSPIRRA